MLKAIEAYLALRRAAGFAMLNAEYLLRSFAAYAIERGQRHVHTQTAIEWAALGPSPAQRDARLKAVCRFVRHVRIKDSRHELPPANHFGARKTRRVPHIYSAAEIDRLIEAALRLRPKGGLRARTHATLIALLSVTGLRISEAPNLTIAHVTHDGLLIRETKFRKTRLVPLHDTAVAGLKGYLALRRPCSETDPVFVNAHGLPLRYITVKETFDRLAAKAGVVPAMKRRPSLHDLRHTFAVRALQGTPLDRGRSSAHMAALASAETVMTVAADPKRMGARVGMTGVLHTWGSALTHHPHIHMIVPGGGLSPDGAKWVGCRPGFFLHVRILSRLFRRLFLDGLMDLHRTGQLAFFGDLQRLAKADAFAQWLAPFRKSEWVVYAKPPFGGPEAVLAYLSRYTHRVAISNARLISADAQTVAFRWKDYRIKSGGRQKVMRLATPEFIRRFLIHVLPDGFHRIRHFGLLASATRKANIRTIRALLCVERPDQAPASGPNAEIIPLTLREPCPCCSGPMRVIEIFRRGQKPMSRAPPREQAA